MQAERCETVARPRDPATELGDSRFFERRTLQDPSHYPATVQIAGPDNVLEYALSPVRGDEGEYLGVMLTFKDVSSQVETARATADFEAEIADLVADAHRQGGEAEAATRQLGSVVDGLRGNGEKVGALLGQLTKVNAQTKMLSLNASIEAERAGSASGAFGVIAAEMRGLADSVATIATELDSLATAIHGDGSLAASTSELVASSVNDLIEHQREMEQRVHQHASA